MSLCIKSTSSGWFLCTGQTHRKVISFDLQMGRKQSERGAVPGGRDWVTSWDLEKISPKVSP